MDEKKRMEHFNTTVNYLRGICLYEGDDFTLSEKVSLLHHVSEVMNYNNFLNETNRESWGANLGFVHAEVCWRFLLEYGFRFDDTIELSEDKFKSNFNYIRDKQIML